MIVPALTLEQVQAIADASLPRKEAARLLAEVDTYCAATGIDGAEFGRMACDFGGWLGLLRRRGTARTRMAALARAFIARYPDGVPAAQRDDVRQATRGMLVGLRGVPAPHRVQVPRARSVGADTNIANDPRPPIADDCDGAALVAAIRAAAVARGMSASQFAKPLSPTNAAALLATLSHVQRPRPAMIARVRALISGAPVPPPPRRAAIQREVADEAATIGMNRGLARSTSTVHEASKIALARPTASAVPPTYSAIEPTDRRPAAWSREPCRYCNVRGDIGCAHQRPYEGMRP